MTAPRRFGPVQFATYLGLEQWQLDRAVSDGLIPGPDRSRGRWSAPIADAPLARIGGIRAAAGTVPDLGAVRAAGVLSRRLGVEVTANGVEELARRDLLSIIGSYKQHALYDGRALEAFTDTGDASEATRAGPRRRPARCTPARPRRRRRRSSARCSPPARIFTRSAMRTGALAGRAGFGRSAADGARGVPHAERDYLPLTAEVLAAHLSGKMHIGLYQASPANGLSRACNCLAAEKLDQDGSESRGLHGVCLPVQRAEFCLVDHLADGLGAVMHVCRARPAAQDKDRNMHLG